MNSKLRILINVTVNVVVILGCVYQVWETANEYFKYPTVTSVRVMDFLPATTIPQVAVCNGYMPGKDYFQKQLMEKPPDGSHPGGDPTLIPGSLHIAGYDSMILNDSDIIQVKRFLGGGYHCFSAKTRHAMKLIPPYLLRNQDFLMKLAIRVTTLFTDWKQTMFPYNIYMTAYKSNFDAPIRNPILAYATDGSISFLLSYSQRVIQLSPPPYDTNCRDYRKDGLTSKHSCFKSCINKFTVRHYNSIFQDHVVDRDKYLIRNPLNYSSGLRQIEQQIMFLKRTLVHNYQKMTGSQLRDIWSRIDYCNASCAREDCETEFILPFSSSVEHHDKGKPFSLINITMEIPREPVIIVTREGKLTLLDLIVYVLSCLNFWFGFCPLNSSTDSIFSKTFISSMTLHLRCSLREGGKVLTNLRILNRLGRCLLNLLVIVGFIYQVWEISSDYFKYPTVTSVSVKDFLPLTTIPQVAICTPWDVERGNKSYVERFQEQLMEKPPDGSHPGGDPVLLNVNTRVVPPPPYTGKTNLQQETVGTVDMKGFLLKGSNCFSVKTRFPVKFPSYFLHDKTTLRMLAVRVLIRTPLTGDFNISQHIDYFFYMTPYDSDFDSPLRAVVGKASKHNGLFAAVLSYSQRVTRLSPPPYDTNCRDYQKHGLVSRDSCLRKCINNFTITNFNAILDDHVVDRKKYLIRANSTSKSFLWPIPSEVKEEPYEDISYLNKSSEYVKGMLHQVREWINYCKNSCSQPDCETEFIIPSERLIQSVYRGLSLRQLHVSVYPPQEPVIIVTSEAKLSPLDFVVYVLSCVSFWFGFCPLNLSTTTFDTQSIYQIVSLIANTFSSLSTRNIDRITRVFGRVRRRRTTTVRPFESNAQPRIFTRRT